MDINIHHPVSEADGPSPHDGYHDGGLLHVSHGSFTDSSSFDPTLHRLHRDVFIRKYLTDLVAAFDEIDLEFFYRESLAYTRRIERDMPREIAVYHERYYPIINILIKLRSFSINPFPNIQNYLSMDAFAWRRVISYFQEHRDDFLQGRIYTGDTARYFGPHIQGTTSPYSGSLSLEDHLRTRLPRLDLRNGTYQSFLQRGVTLASGGRYSPTRSFAETPDLLIALRQDIIPELRQTLAEYVSFRSSAVVSIQRGTIVALSNSLEKILPELRSMYDINDRFLQQLSLLEQRVDEMLDGNSRQSVATLEDIVLLLHGLREFFSHFRVSV